MPETPELDWRALENFAFGDTPDLADELGALVVAGLKTATGWAVVEGLKGIELGKMMVALDGSSRPLAVLQTVELTQRRFHDVDAAFAFDEGEGDRSLTYWRQAHRRYFTRRGQFAPGMLLNCERFRVVMRLDDPACP